jgi:hypothetical protein
MMDKTAFLRGFADEMEKNGIAILAPLAAMAGRAIASQGIRSLVGRVATNLGPKILSAGRQVAGKAMSQGTKGGVPGLGGKLTKGLNIASNLGGFADIMRARQQKQPANAGNTITTPGH